MQEKILNIVVTANSSKDEITKISEGKYKIKVSALPVKGKANRRVEELLAKYFDVSKNQVQIIKGEKNKNKLVYLKLN
jgi:hypothetical protein